MAGKRDRDRIIPREEALAAAAEILVDAAIRIETERLIAEAARRAGGWLSPEQVCDRVPGMTKDRLADLRDRGRGPAFHKPTLRTVIYAVEDVDAWVRATRTTTRDQS